MSRFRHNPVSAGVPVVQRWRLWSTRAIGLHGVAAGGLAQPVLPVFVARGPSILEPNKQSSAPDAKRD